MNTLVSLRIDRAKIRLMQTWKKKIRLFKRSQIDLFRQSLNYAFNAAFT